MPIPSQLPEWDTNSVNVVEPNAGKKANGWANLEPPSAGIFNWWQEKAFRWIEHLEKERADAIERAGLARPAPGDGASAATLTDAMLTIGSVQAIGEPALITPDSSYVGSFEAACFLDGANGWILVGSGAAIQQTHNLATCSARTKAGAFSGVFRAAAAGSAACAIAGDSGEIQTASISDTGTWTKRTQAGSYSGIFRAAASDGATTFLVCGGGGEIQTSTNLSTWAKRAQAGGYSGAFRAAACANGTWYVGGDDGEIQTSTNLSTWAKRANPAGVAAISSIAASNAVAIACNDMGSVLRSTDSGATWAQVSPASMSGAQVARVTRVSSGWIASGTVASTKALWFSPDGLQWVRVSTPSFYTSTLGGSAANVLVGAPTPWLVIAGANGRIFRSGRLPQ